MGSVVGEEIGKGAGSRPWNQGVEVVGATSDQDGEEPQRNEPPMRDPCRARGRTRGRTRGRSRRGDGNNMEINDEAATMEKHLSREEMGAGGAPARCTRERLQGKGSEHRQVVESSIEHIFKRCKGVVRAKGSFHCRSRCSGPAIQISPQWGTPPPAWTRTRRESEKTLAGTDARWHQTVTIS